MKHYKIPAVLSAVLLFFQVQAYSQVRFIEVTVPEEMEEARRKASDKDLPMFVDVYADWCTPCKIMDREVYSDPDVGDYMNAKFINVRMNGEIEFGAQFAAENELQGYPSAFLFDPEGSHISTLMGFMGKDELVEKLRGTMNNYRLTGELDARYHTGNLQKHEYPVLLSLLREAGEPERAEGIAREYMTDIDSEGKISDDDIRVAGHYITMDHPLWSVVSDDVDRMQEVLGDEYLAVVESVFNNTLIKGIEEEDRDIIRLLSDNIGRFVEGSDVDAESLKYLPFLQYYYYSGKNDELIAYVDQTYSEQFPGDHEWLFRTASTIIDMDQQYNTELIQSRGVEWFQACLELEERFDYYFYKGMCLYFTYRFSESEAAFNSAGKLAGDADEQALIEQVLQYIHSTKQD